MQRYDFSDFYGGIIPSATGAGVSLADSDAELARLRSINAELVEALGSAMDLICCLSPLEGDTVRQARTALARAKEMSQ
jgi:hypothetical protein